MKAKIGLETHVQLATKSKVFCGCKNPLAREEKPNTLTCPTCLGLPGGMPRLNESVVELGIKAAKALNCKVKKTIKFSRKSYFYPDLPKNYQITQWDFPLGENGFLKLGRSVRIKRIQIEEDPGKLIHVGGLGGETLVDYNRSGVPLLEIVTEPDLTSPKEAREYVQKLALILEYLGLYDPNSLAILKSDANISLKGGERVEVKNITGTKEVEQALNYEIARQRSLRRRGKKVVKETRSWVPENGVTKLLRTKEEEEEYGHITEPDLTKIIISRDLVKKYRIPELPDEKFQRFRKEYSLPKRVIESLVGDIEMARMFERLVKKIGKPKLIGTWLAGYVKKTLNYNNVGLKKAMTQKDLEYIFSLLIDNKITDKNAEMTLRAVVAEKQTAKYIVAKYDYLVKRFDISLEMKDVVEKYPKAVKDFKEGNKSALNFLIGKGMKKTKGGVNAKDIEKCLRIIINGI